MAPFIMAQVGTSMGYDVPLNGSLSLANGDRLLIGNAGDPPFILVRTNPVGQVIWARTIGQVNANGKLEVVGTNDGGLMMSMNSPIGPVIVHADADGGVLWAESVHVDAGLISSGELCATTDGHFMLHVRGVAPDTTNLLIKFDGTGGVIWAKQPVDPAHLLVDKVVTATTDGSLLLGGTDCTSALARIDDSGTPEWFWTFDCGQAGCWRLDHVVQLPYGDMMVSHIRTSAAGGPSDLLIGRLDPTGSVIHYSAFDPVQGFDILPGMCGLVAMDDGVVCAPRDPLHARFARVDTTGAVTWAADLPANNITYGIAHALNDSIVATVMTFTPALGSSYRIATNQPPSECFDQWVLAPASSFVIQAPHTFTMVDVPVSTAPYIIATTPIIVSATPLCGTAGITDALVDDALQAWHDPVTDQVVIHLPNMDRGPFTIAVSDTRGRELLQRSMGTSTDAPLTLDASGLLSGVYAISFTQAQQRWGTKVVVIR